MPTPATNTDAPGDDAESDELVALRLELWAARDAAFGAIAEAGTLRARGTELEALVHQLRLEVDRLAYVEQSMSYKLGNAIVGPLRAARRLTK